ncbi:hypothetical protein A3K34_02300 [candidate division WWE3 bacterium RIFOXYC1_FULL_40_10]|uniref:Uncharacterized protein n=1 Tax=candidate division WWE3 bacterium RIFOXYA2_FULL_46_9 TaxID=1802636 RepID=A0A1F4VZ03_UNCKA|nr:MAG: hypothetical protein A3K58_02300 [candidate division WWE3 bacterium RIFOXYB1_FULL_40_22]OGC61685.1 MAG: hypothetical protein A3K37_02300 [candidate division WWE3 bacterium RIFOXYA1_FULL_40_11]OGC62330.1 MAG: hypothetical protein A2264_02070 [candidate division WWE3 bacterium RIFOXYA2_FULL_46_9]OGC64860.1 MAG: hypothetical protein A2326_01125 [candidate division WWE3 bacterium RIFOXYB2_FULL_41_6]OGC66068.1 MAG: hypothetical protein A3K34_02300 [candidate division WWE3 bacterium RIFOXYC1_
MENIEIKQKFVELRAKGNSFQKIADELGVTKQTLINWSKDLQTDIRNMKALELDSLLTKYKMTQECQIELYGELLEKITAEVKSRSLQDLSTDKLFSAYFKLFENIMNTKRTITLEKESVWEIEPQKTLWTT